jgi:hypothetical protein
MAERQLFTIYDANGEVLWRAQAGPQQDLFDLTLNPHVQAQEILLGGARSGGKTEALIAWMTIHIDKPLYRGLILRKTAESLKEFCDRAWQLYEKMGAKREGRPTEFVFPSGARIYTNHFKDERSLEDVKGHEYHLIGLEEATQIEKEVMYEQLLGSNRSTVPGIRAAILLTTNPDGPGNYWIKKRFVQVTIDGIPVAAKQPFRGKNKKVRVFIPARITDNLIMMERDPSFFHQLAGMENEALRRAWFLGDWDCQEGTMFPEFRPTGPRDREPERANHVIPARSLPPWCHRWASLDWGFAHHAAAYWFGNELDRRTHVYREMVVRGVGAEELGMEFARRTMPDLEGMSEPSITLYFSHEQFSVKNSGKSVAEQLATGIDRILGPGSCFLVAKTEQERLSAEAGEDAVVANEMFAERFRDQYSKAKIVLRRSSSDRVAQANVARDFLKWRHIVEKVEPDMAYARKLLEMPQGNLKYLSYMAKFEDQQEQIPLPRLQIHDCCRILIQTIPLLRPDPKDLEKVKKFHGDPDRDTIGDDPWDALSYGLMGASEQQNVIPRGEFIAKEVLRQVGKDADINLKIQVAIAAATRYNKDNSENVIHASFTRDAMRTRWQPN